MKITLIVACAALLTARDLSNPFEGNEKAQRAGAKLFARECAPCHGVHLEGHGKAPSLVNGAPPEMLFRVLRDGRVFSGMPSFAHLPEQQRWQIVAFLEYNARK